VPGSAFFYTLRGAGCNKNPQFGELLKLTPMTYEMFKDIHGQFRWRLRAANGRSIAVSGEGYNNRTDCLAAINLVKASASAPVVDNT
jgi:uncharacterized protein YegP (UPF0339 family)